MNVGPIDFNSIIVIESLLENDTQTGKQLFNDILKRRCEQLENSVSPEYQFVSSKKEHKELLSSILERMETSNFQPIIHYEIHGCTKGVVLKNQELILWSELITFLKKANQLTNNNIFVTFATCYSTAIFNSIDIRTKCPFWGIISSDEEVKTENIALNYTGFYDTLLTTKSVESAIDSLNKQNKEIGFQLKFINSETFIKKLISHVNKKYYLNPETLKRLEDEAVAQAMSEQPEVFNNDPEFARQIIKFWYSNRELMFQKVLDTYLYKK